MKHFRNTCSLFPSYGFTLFRTVSFLMGLQKINLSIGLKKLVSFRLLSQVLVAKQSQRNGLCRSLLTWTKLRKHKRNFFISHLLKVTGVFY